MPLALASTGASSIGKAKMLCTTNTIDRERRVKVALFITVLVLVGGCSTVTISADSDVKLASAPDYKKRKNFFFWGLMNEHSVDVNAVCEAAAPLQMQSQQTAVDVVLGVVTLGIYAPRTAKVWCS